jgi:hypothetical protein
MDYASNEAQAKMSHAATDRVMSDRPASVAPRALTDSRTLAGIAQRLFGMAELHGNGLNGIASKLNEHADIVHGHVPESDERDMGPVASNGPGALGMLLDAVDNLNAVLERSGSRVAMAAGRNCTLG